MQQKSYLRKIGQYTIDKRKLLGTGGYAKVYEGYHRTTEKKVAIKVLNKQRYQKDQYLFDAIRQQIKIMKMITEKTGSSNVIRFLHVQESEKNLYIIQELAENGSLSQLLQQKKAFEEKMVIEFITQIIFGMGDLVSNGIIHRDIKPSNILIHNQTLKIADFGLSTFFTPSDLLLSKVGTPIYMAPQILQEKKYSHKCDIWSIGLVCYEMLTGSLPWKAKPQRNLYESIKLFVKGGIPFPKQISVSDQLKNFIAQCLQIQESKRFDWPKVFLHPIFSGAIKHKFIKNIDFTSAFAISTLRVSVRSQNISLNKLLQEMPDQISRPLFFSFLSLLAPDLEEVQLNSLFNKITQKPVIQKQELKLFFWKGKIMMEGNKLSSFKNSAYNSERKRINGYWQKIEKQIHERKLDLPWILKQYFLENQEAIDIEAFATLITYFDEQLEGNPIKQLFMEFNPDKEGKIKFQSVKRKLCQLGQILLVGDKMLCESAKIFHQMLGSKSLVLIHSV